VPGYYVGGKTGTAQIWDPKANGGRGNWLNNVFNYSFVGFIGKTAPRLVIAVQVHEGTPTVLEQGHIEMPVMSFELFRRIATDAITTLDLPPAPKISLGGIGTGSGSGSSGGSKSSGSSSFTGDPEAPSPDPSARPIPMNSNAATPTPEPTATPQATANPDEPTSSPPVVDAAQAPDASTGAPVGKTSGLTQLLPTTRGGASPEATGPPGSSASAGP
jgi:hypothetical protein